MGFLDFAFGSPESCGFCALKPGLVLGAGRGGGVGCRVQGVALIALKASGTIRNFEVLQTGAMGLFAEFRCAPVGRDGCSYSGGLRHRGEGGAWMVVS